MEKMKQVRMTKMAKIKKVTSWAVQMMRKMRIKMAGPHRAIKEIRLHFGPDNERRYRNSYTSPANPVKLNPHTSNHSLYDTQPSKRQTVI
jgi:hypothetical protein